MIDLLENDDDIDSVYNVLIILLVQNCLSNSSISLNVPHLFLHNDFLI